MRTLSILVLAATAGFSLGAPSFCAAQDRIAGRANIIDGDSFEIGEKSVRLFGIDAPEGRQSCTRDGREWACGTEAERKLRSLIGGRTVMCAQRDVDSYGRIVAVCRSGAADLAAEMARSGFATAYRRYSSEYVDEEDQARAARRGIWAGAFAPPEDYRRDNQRASSEPRRGARSPTRCDGCYIKGNVNAKGERIYHVPESPSYDDTAIDASKGERWFRTENEARAAGWRAPRG